MPSQLALNLSRHQDVSLGYSVLAATDYTTATQKIAGKANHTIHICRIVIGVTTDDAATQTFQDDESTPIKLVTSKASPGLGTLEYDFGPNGFPLTEGADFDHIMSAAGLAASFTIVAYMKRTGVVNV